MGAQVKYLISKLQDSFDGNPWYGDSMIDKLNSVNYKIVNQVSPNFSNSIANLVQHIIIWRIYVIKKIQARQKFEIEINGASDWANISVNSESEWKSLLNDLYKTQCELIEELMNQSDKILDKPVPDRAFNYRFLIEGINQYDIYHLGQIGLMAKLETGKQ